MTDEKVFKIDVGPVTPRDFGHEGADVLVRIWRGWYGSTSANTEPFTKEQFRQYVTALNVYLEGMADG
jgi:hypothetical protein